VTDTPQPRLPALSALPLGGASDEALDPELVELPDPPRRARTLTVLFLAIAAAVALLATLSIRREVAYALAGGSPAALGDLRLAPAGALAESENRPVRAEGMLGAAGGIRYERPFVDDSFRALPVVGRAEPLDMWVEVRVPAGLDGGQGAWAPPRSFAGRLVRLDAAGPRHRGLRAAIEEATHEHIPADAWLVVDGEDPPDARWAIAVSMMFLGIAAWNVAVAARILRKVRA
jgi:hypothetical protein